LVTEHFKEDNAGQAPYLERLLHKDVTTGQRDMATEATVTLVMTLAEVGFGAVHRNSSSITINQILARIVFRWLKINKSWRFR
tara:strand:+ start:406 stop:654 length:249 start_codon:yes stop_codon:yes gene_type:complete